MYEIAHSTQLEHFQQSLHIYKPTLNFMCMILTNTVIFSASFKPYCYNLTECSWDCCMTKWTLHFWIVFCILLYCFLVIIVRTCTIGC